MDSVAVSASGATGVEALSGWSFSETTGLGVARVRLRAGSVSGEIVAGFRVASAGSSTVAFPEPLVVGDGVYFELVSGSVEGALFEG